MKKRFTHRWLLGLVLPALVLGAAMQPADKIMLRLRLHEGEVFRFTVTLDQSIKQTVMDEPQNMTQQIGMGYRFDVLSVADEVYDVRVTYYRVAFEQEGVAGDVSYDSDDPPETVPPMAIGFAALLNQSFTMKMDARGHVLDVHGVDALLEAMVAEYERLGMAPGNGLKESLKQQFGDETIRTNMENLMAVYPDEEVGIGDTWTNTAEVQTGMPLRLTNTFRLAAREEGTAKIDLETVIEPGDGAPMDVGGMQLAYVVSGTQRGTSWMDEASGLPVRSTMMQTLAGDVTMNDSMTWPIEIETRTIMEADN